jgi:cell wall assembly regulator SMI1
VCLACPRKAVGMVPGESITADRTMREIWQRIITWFAANAPPNPYFFCFADGATAAEVEATESILGFRLSEDVRESYLIHNGNMGHSGVFENQLFLPLEEVIRHWRLWSEGLARGRFKGLKPPQRIGPIKDTWWNARWVPITDSGSGDHICVDMDLASGGSVGQIIRTNHEVGPLRVLASGFREFLKQFADDLEAGEYWYDVDSMMIRRH